MIYEANEPSSACRLWRTYQVETCTPPNGGNNMLPGRRRVKDAAAGVTAVATFIRELPHRL